MCENGTNYLIFWGLCKLFLLFSISEVKLINTNSCVFKTPSIDVLKLLVLLNTNATLERIIMASVVFSPWFLYLG